MPGLKSMTQYSTLFIRYRFFEEEETRLYVMRVMKSNSWRPSNVKIKLIWCHWPMSIRQLYLKLKNVISCIDELSTQTSDLYLLWTWILSTRKKTRRKLVDLVRSIFISRSYHETWSIYIFLHIYCYRVWDCSGNKFAVEIWKLNSSCLIFSPHNTENRFHFPILFG